MAEIHFKTLHQCLSGKSELLYHLYQQQGDKYFEAPELLLLLHIL